MRLMLNTLVAVMVAGLLAGAFLHRQNRGTETQTLESTQRDLHQINLQVALRAALKRVPLSSRGYPMEIKPDWFEDGLPQNHLLSRSRPWLEIAGRSDADHRHPRDPVAHYENQSMFWYNPHTGDVRARVPAQISEAATLELYNRVNGSNLKSW